uniref:ATP synthase F0 subunit 8 n=1 Tax=Psammotettix sp. EMHAU-2015-Zz053036 TaxID=2038643 RepID=A0A343K603_9HEMI|nr:ATP synthase F0 subunit 8 [Psammotettix sp. EMHAU-2015-Zz053036]
MPQMSPMWWTLIMFTVASILFLNISMNYFEKINLIKTKKDITNMVYHWKW